MVVSIKYILHPYIFGLSPCFRSHNTLLSRISLASGRKGEKSQQYRRGLMYGIVIIVIVDVITTSIIKKIVSFNNIPKGIKQKQRKAY